MTEDDSEDGDESLTARIGANVTAFTALTADFYRAEVDRTTAWRARLDQTTNWAVVLVAAILTWAFSSPDNPHYVVLIGIAGTTAFLLMEATRYREYDIWRDRVRTLQEGLFADVYAPDRAGDDRWQAELGEELRTPEFNMSFQAALTHRLRRSYLALLFILLAAWIARITVFKPGESWRETASILVFPGAVVTAAVAAFYLLVVVVTAWSARDERVREFEE